MQSNHHVKHTWMALAALSRNSSSGSVGSNSGSSPSSNVSPSSRASASSTYFTPITEELCGQPLHSSDDATLCRWTSFQA